MVPAKFEKSGRHVRCKPDGGQHRQPIDEDVAGFIQRTVVPDAVHGDARVEQIDGKRGVSGLEAARRAGRDQGQ